MLGLLVVISVGATFLPRHDARPKAALQESLQELIAHRLPNAHVGFIVTDAETGKTIESENSYQAFAPASNMKLFTAAAALLELGKGFRYETTVGYLPNQLDDHVLKGNLYVTFSGDPSLQIKELIDLIQQSKQQGVRTITGNVVLDDSRFAKPYHAPGWSQDDLAWGYAAPISAIIVNSNRINIAMSPNRTLGKPASVIKGDGVPYVKLNTQVKTVSERYADRHCHLQIEGDQENHLELGGCWPQLGKVTDMFLAVPNPNLFAANIITQALQKAGIKLQGKVITGSTPKNIKLVAKHRSPRLTSMVYTMLKDSNNVYAESFTKTLGYKVSGKGSFQEGINAIKQIIDKATGIDMQQARIADGSGASRYNLVTPRQIARLLYVMAHDKDLGDIFKKALPKAGTDGTLKRRLASFDVVGNVQAKTGTFTGASTLSGYMTTRNGKELIFVIMVNQNTSTMRQAQQLQDELLTALTQVS